MKCKFFIFALAAALLIGALSACSPAAVTLPKNLPAPTEGVAPAPTQGAVPPTEPVQHPEAQITPETISAEKAQSIALTHAGLRADQVTGLRSKHEIDDGVPHYDVKFRADNREYDYEIHAKTGAILSFESEKIGAGQNAASTQKPASSDTSEIISAEKAQSIALAHAGLQANQVTGLRAKYEIDDGVPLYEVEFRSGRWEYDYEIHAKTGAVLSFDKDD